MSDNSKLIGRDCRLNLAEYPISLDFETQSPVLHPFHRVLPTQQVTHRLLLVEISNMLSLK